MNIVITGAASGIGCHLVTLASRGGHAVLATDVDLARLQTQAGQCGWPSDRVTLRAHDVTCATAWSELVAQAVDRFGGLDCLVNVAGVLRVEPVYELDPRSVAQQLDVN